MSLPIHAVLPDLLALDMWIEDELDRRMAGNDEMENGA